MPLRIKITADVGTPNCGKGEPGQVAHVGHGAAPPGLGTCKWE